MGKVGVGNGWLPGTAVLQVAARLAAVGMRGRDVTRRLLRRGFRVPERSGEPREGEQAPGTARGQPPALEQGAQTPALGWTPATGWTPAMGQMPTPGQAALPPGQPEELALPASHPGQLALPPGPGSGGASPGVYLLPPGSAAGGTLPQAPAARRWRTSEHWTMMLLGVSLALLVMCALPLWTFGVWSLWRDYSHTPPPVLARLSVNGQGAVEAQWSPDGKFLAEQVTLAGARAGDAQGSAVVLWGVEGRREVRRFVGADGGLAAAWSPDGLWLATSNGKQVVLWRAADVEAAGGNAAPFARLAAPDAREAITSVAWGKDGQALAVADEGGLGIWEPMGGSAWQQAMYFRDGPCATILCGRRALWSPDGRWLLVAPWHGKAGASGVGVWDAQTWKPGPLLNAAAALAWSPDSSLVVVRDADETTLSALRAGSWTVAWRLNPNTSLDQGYAVFPQAAGWSPDGRWLVGSADGWVELWRTDTRKSVWVWEEQAADEGVYTATSLAWSPDGGTLAVTTDGRARLTLYDLGDPQPPIAAPPVF